MLIGIRNYYAKSAVSLIKPWFSTATSICQSPNAVLLTDKDGLIDKAFMQADSSVLATNAKKLMDQTFDKTSFLW